MRYELIVIGASWGGLGAVGAILARLPRGFSVPMAVAQHRGPSSSDEALAAALAAYSAVPVRSVEDKDPIPDAGVACLAPADYHLLVEPGRFALSLEEKVRHSRPSIDVLFESAADAYAERLIGLVLTGANADGAAGLRRVRDHGGLGLAQDPATAERPEMPRAAIAAGGAERVLPLDRLGPALAEACCGSGVTAP